MENSQGPAFALEGETLHSPNPRQYSAHEYKVVSLRECPLPADMMLCDKPDTAAAYWQANIASDKRFNAEVETMVVLLLNSRRRIKAHVIIATGTMDTILIHPREIFRAAIIAGAAAIVLMHNHPSGESSPSEADIKATREAIRAGQLLKMDVIDHVIIGRGERSSLREMGYFYS